MCVDHTIPILDVMSGYEGLPRAFPLEIDTGLVLGERAVTPVERSRSIDAWSPDMR